MCNRVRWAPFPSFPLPESGLVDMETGELCWVTGTIYMDMPLKPNILNDITKD